MRTDWLGNEYDVNDLIIYAAMSGRSVTMVLARVVSFNESGSVTVCPVRSSRWKQHSGRSFYIDNRTGKRIDPWKSDKHIEIKGHYVHKDNPDWTLSYNEYYDLPYYVRTGGKNDRNAYRYISTKFKDYVEYKTEPTQKVTLQVTENIVKWTGELPEEKEEK